MEERLGIAGAGAIACGLAATAARHGEVVLWARSDGSAQRARGHVDRACDKLGAIDPGRVRVVTDLRALSEATILVEAVVEERDAKAALLRDLAAHARGGALIATTTSSLSIEDLAEESGRPDRFLGLHVFNPVPRMELVELCFPAAAGEETRARARALCAALGKTPVEVPDLPGFVVNRLLFPFLFGAVALAEQTGMAPEDVDACVRLGAGHPMGPIALLDFVGLDVAEAIGDAIGTPVPRRIRDLVAAGCLGRKTGRGLLAYD